MLGRYRSTSVPDQRPLQDLLPAGGVLQDGVTGRGADCLPDIRDQVRGTRPPPPEVGDVERCRSVLTPQGAHYTPRRRELLRLSPLPAGARASASLETSPFGFRPISPTSGGSHPALHLAAPVTRHSISRSPSPTLSARSLSPLPRPRAHTFSGLQLPPRSPARLPRDPLQPARGSICDLTAGDRPSPADDEEADSFNFRPFQRPRSSTCPENRAWRRRKMAAQNRPPTPPLPLGAGTSPRGSLTDGLTTSGHGGRRCDLSDLPRLSEDQDGPADDGGQEEVTDIVDGLGRLHVKKDAAPSRCGVPLEGAT